MPAQSLPSISRFQTGLVTQRNPIDTPFSIVGMNVVQHHDALIDGQNMEVSNNDTLTRRFGISKFSTVPIQAGEQIDHAWLFKNLTGTIRLIDTSNQRVSQFTTSSITSIWNNTAGNNPWSIAITGNYLYAVNGTDTFRWQPDNPDTSGNVIFGIGIAAPTVAPTLFVNSLQLDTYTSTFIPSGDAIQGNIQITMATINLVLNVQIAPSSLTISILNNNYPLGTAAISAVTGTTTPGGIATNTLIDPGSGESETEITVPFTAPLTIAQFATLVNDNIAVSGHPEFGVPTTIFVEILGNALPGSLGDIYPVVDGSALMVYSTSVGLSIADGLGDLTTPSFPLTLSPGQPNIQSIFILPFINNTDIISGSVTFGIRTNHGSFASETFTVPAAPNNNIAGLAGQFGDPVALTSIVNNQTQLTILGDPPSSSTSALNTNNQTTTITAISLQNVTQNYALQFKYSQKNSYSLKPLTSYGYGYVWKNPTTFHVSTMSPPTNVAGLSTGSQIEIIFPLSNDPQSTQAELYRTADGGSSYILDSLIYFTPPVGNVISCVDNTADTELNPQIVAPLSFANNPPPIGIQGLVKHVNRMWGFVDNKVYYSGGPDTTNGLGDEAWPPANYYSFPGNVVKIESTANGLAVFLTDDLHIIEGVDVSSFYEHILAAGFGISNFHAATYDGQTLFIYTTNQQLHALSPSGQGEIGYAIGDQLAQYFPATTTNLTMHRGTSTDNALYVTNGTDSIFRYNPATSSWSVRGIYSTGVSSVTSIETTPGNRSLIIGTDTTISKRDLTLWTDNGTPYNCFATIGGMATAPPGNLEPIDNILAQMYQVGSSPEVSILINELDGDFAQIGVNTPLNDPPTARYPSKTLRQMRWYTTDSLIPINQLSNTLFIKFAFPTENFKNEILGVYVRSDK